MPLLVEFPQLSPRFHLRMLSFSVYFLGICFDLFNRFFDSGRKEEGGMKEKGGKGYVRIRGEREKEEGEGEKKRK